jgi:pimeloyl-ACP methyl ester carboxylesterase
MSARRSLLPSLLLALSSLASAQDVRSVQAEHRSGQTFVTWRESSIADTRYRVYRSEEKIVNDGDLDDAELLGEVDDRSGRNQGRSLASGAEHGWVISTGGSELDKNEGLFVYTVESPSSRVFYAITTVRDGREDRRVRSGGNTTSTGIEETPDAPEPVRQDRDGSGELWAHWVSDRDTPYLPALCPWPSQGFNFRFEPGSAPAPRGLVVRLHSAGQTYSQGWPHRFEVQSDVDILALSDLQPYTSWSFWFGAQELLPGTPRPGTRVWNYTQQRILWTLDWIQERLGSAHDRERVYAVGGSMGAIGAMWLAEEAPERFAAILCRNGLYDLSATDYRNPPAVEAVFGRFALGLLTRDGLPILDRTRAIFMASRAPAEDWPVIRTISGRNDETVGWSSAVGLMDGLSRTHRPAVHYFDERTHNPNGYWVDLERQLLARTFKTRRDRPCLRFDECSLDDDPGDGSRTDGDMVGTVNGYLDYDLGTAVATSAGLDFDVYLRASGALDDAPEATGWAALTPRRTKPFLLVPGERVRFALSSGGVLVDEHVLVADEHGLVQTPRAPLERTPRHARFERWKPSSTTHLFLGAAPITGDELQAVVNGVPGARWTLFLGWGDSRGAAFYQLGVDYYVFRGVFEASGLAQVWLKMPDSVPAGTWIWGTVHTAGKLWPRVGVQVQNWR